MLNLLCFTLVSVVLAFVSFFIFALIKVLFGTKIERTINPYYLSEFCDYAYNLKMLSKKEKELYIKPFEDYIMAFVEYEMNYNIMKKIHFKQQMKKSKKIIESRDFRKLEMKVNFLNPRGCGSALIIESLILGIDEKMIQSKLVFKKTWYR